MNFDIKKVKLVVTVPPQNLDDVRNAVCNAGAGVIGNYSYCSMSTKCIGTFKPNNDAHPYIGESGKIEHVEEIKLEVICDISNVKKTIEKLKEVHPYEELEIDIIPLLDEEMFK